MSVAPLFVGVMSGTSLDGADAVLVSLAPSAQMTVLGHHHLPFPLALRDELDALNQPHGVNELHRACVAADQLARVYAQLVHEVLNAAQISASQVCAIGAHGQTVRHRPPAPQVSTPYTLQLNQPALLAELTGIDVVADFRSRDMAAGGQGAPLVPAFHQALFGHLGAACAILNLGGISNVTVLSTDVASVLGFDCGPANILMDLWCKRHLGLAFDAQGRWAAGGRMVPALLEAMLAEPYFAMPPPRSTGRDLFNMAWLERLLQALPSEPTPQDVQATLCELTAVRCAQDIQQYAPHVRTLLVCGGGALNEHLMHRLAVHLTPCQVSTTQTKGLPVMQVEACAFAWLAWAYVHRLPGSVVGVTGALGPRVLGALYPA